ncbi:hypothetical protein [Burkholderia diffusa]|uniref:hypothetical protein n=1 Tax=Burkholderia diffusa TaxID=488732 RepID=UPI0018C5E707|nr:hypothetical protein [Burkholderia diffusa]
MPVSAKIGIDIARRIQSTALDRCDKWHLDKRVTAINDRRTGVPSGGPVSPCMTKGDAPLKEYAQEKQQPHMLAFESRDAAAPGIR